MLKVDPELAAGYLCTLLSIYMRMRRCQVIGRKLIVKYQRRVNLLTLCKVLGREVIQRIKEGISDTKLSR